MNCPKCGTELVTDCIDYLNDNRIDSGWLLSNPYLMDALSVDVKCKNCKKGMRITFHKTSYKTVDDMIRMALEQFVVKMRADGERRIDEQQSKG